MDPISAKIDTTQLHVDQDEIFRLLGNQAEGADSHTRDLVDRYREKVLEVASPCGTYAIWKANDLFAPDEIATDGLSFRTGKIIRKLLKSANSFAFFIATVGPGPENLCRKLMEEGNYLEGYIADLIASFLVEAVTDQVHMVVRTKAASLGMNVTNRYSPGYCSWDVSEQQKLFSLFPRNNCGITLSESSLMSPIKSISGVIGIGESVRYQEYICEICSMKDCQFRKSGS